MTQIAAARLGDQLRFRPGQVAACIDFASNTPRRSSWGTRRGAAAPRRAGCGLVHRRPGSCRAQGAICPKVVLYMLPFAVAMILLAARIWQAAAHPAPMTGATRTPATTTSPDTAAAPLLTPPGS